jgi:hypothetical protein
VRKLKAFISFAIQADVWVQTKIIKLPIESLLCGNLGKTYSILYSPYFLINVKTCKEIPMKNNYKKSKLKQVNISQ